MIIRCFTQLVLAVLIPIAALAATPPAPIAKTGQTKCYSSDGSAISCAGTGQDGDIRAGVELPSPRFTDNGDQTLTDMLTGLIWAKDANLMKSRDPSFDADYFADFSDGWTESIGDGAVTWQRSLDYVNKLNAESYLGFSDWRLPNINELKSLLTMGADDSYSNLDMLQNNGFKNLSYPYQYWSSSYYSYGTVWGVLLGYGIAQYKYSDRHLMLLPVRGKSYSIPMTGQKLCYNSVNHTGEAVNCYGTGQDGELKTGVVPPVLRFSDNGDQTITDNLTGIIWTKDTNTPGPSLCIPATDKSWLDAFTFIECINSNDYLGKNDWRLPNVSEIESLSNLGVLDTVGWLKTFGFTNIPQNYFWTSTTSCAPNLNGKKWAYQGYAGDVGPVEYVKTAINQIWPIRGGHWDALKLSPERSTFVDTVIGSVSSESEITITNGLSTPISITSIAVTGLDENQFFVAPGGVNACTSLAPKLLASQSCTVHALFVPSSVGQKHANLQIVYLSDYSNIVTEPLSGTGVTLTPSITDFTIPMASTSLVIPINKFTAIDDTGVVGYCVTQINDSSSCSWKSTVPISFTVNDIPQAVTTVETIYAFVRDDKFNISPSISAKVTITLPDTIAPNISLFDIASTCKTLVVPIKSFLVNDNVNVTGYCISELNNSNACSWAANVPTQYTFAFAVPETKTLYAFAKDAANNISSSATKSIVIDSISPVLSSFKLPETSVSPKVLISELFATDNVGVTGYLFTETPDTPSALVGSWSVTKPDSITFVGIPDGTITTKTLYAWAKDSTGNISNGVAAFVTITLPISGECGSSNSTAFSAAPTTNLCSTGSSSSVTGSGPWNWSCSGSNGGSVASCSAQLLVPSVNGICGSSNSTAFSAAPTTNLCSTGSSSSVTGSGPWNWSCSGSNGGSVASCSARIQTLVINAATGDINGDGVVDVGDALLALRISVALVPMDPKYLVNGDVAPMVNGKPQPDGTIDVGDALLILRKCVQLVNW